MLFDQILDATRQHWFSKSVLALHPTEPHALIAHIKPLLTAGLAPRPDATPQPPAGPAPTAAFLAHSAPDALPRPDDTVSYNVTVTYPSNTSTCYYSFERFRANATQPYRTTRLPDRPFRPPPGPSNTCHICRAPDKLCP